MRIICKPADHHFEAREFGDLGIILYGHDRRVGMGSIGATIRKTIHKCRLQPASRAWDLLSIALSVIAADTGVKRKDSPDGWTRRLDLNIAVCDPDFWNSQSNLLVRQLNFLTTDVWSINFIEGGAQPLPIRRATKPDQDCVSLLSGGLDSLVGTIDLVKPPHKKSPYLVSQVSQGDKHTQRVFASNIGSGTAHLQLNHNVDIQGENERSQRARSFVFLSYGVLVATSLARYRDGKEVTLYVCENGFISINPPLTNARVGSLSTRTTHPVFLDLFQRLLHTAGLRVNLVNPYQFQTKSEMLKNCSDQSFLHRFAHISTSCGRYARNSYKHCGRCLPCLIRRTAFHSWDIADRTEYVYSDLSVDDDDHARYDDVRSAAMAVASVKNEGLSQWAASTLSTALLGDVMEYRDVVRRGLDELRSFLSTAKVL